MILREMRKDDIPYIKECMSIVDNKFIETYFYSALNSQIENNESVNQVYYTIATEANEYMGTTCLKNIDITEGTAEFFIVVRNCAMGKGYAWHGMAETLKNAFDNMGLERIYWCVEKKNLRAIRFFTKHGFNMLDEDVPKNILTVYKQPNDYVWFAVLKGDDYLNEALSKGDVAGCKIIRIKTIPTIEAGELSYFEVNNDIDFEIKRIYYISKVPEGVRRGFHAHKQLKQLLFCPYGKIQLILENDRVREEITLSDPSIGIVINSTTWREMLWMQKDSVLVVAASDFYDANDYIRDYNEFKNYIKKNN